MPPESPKKGDPKSPSKKFKDETFLPFTMHSQYFILPSNWMIKNESQQIYQNIEKKLIQEELRIKTKMVTIILHEARIKYQKELNTVN